MTKVRFGLCCLFREYPIRFRTRQAKYIMKFKRSRQLEILSETILGNSISLVEAVKACRRDKIGCFRVNSRFLPLKTHPDVQYGLSDLPDCEVILETLSHVRSFCERHDVRLTFHPDQFILLTSPDERVRANSIADLEYHDELADLIGADVITIHAGGGYGDKRRTLDQLRKVIAELSDSLRGRLAIENDDRIYSPQDLLPLCSDLGVPFVYDVHHHRCLPDSLTVERASEAAMATWNREPVFHLSSPKGGWEATNPRAHDDMIDPDDFPGFWYDLPVTVEIEAKAKELAIKRLQSTLEESSA